MNERFYLLCYMFLSAVAAWSVAVFLLSGYEILAFSVCNLSVTIFIYYNYRALNAPAGEVISLLGCSLLFTKTK
jgi:hypothetical protein